jgi:superfamily II DNA or RNA helicase
VNRQRRQEAKKKRRERENRAERRRRFESDHCRALVLQADAMWRGAGDLAEARRLLEKAVRIRPGFQDAHERLAELDIRSQRFLEGISHYEQLTRPPDWPQLTYMAAVAAYQLGRFDQARTLARLFLQTARNYPELKAARADARQLRDRCKALARQNRAPSHETLAPPSHRRPSLDETPLRQGSQIPLSFERPSIETRSNAGSHAGDPSVAGNRPQRSRAPRAPEDPLPNPPTTRAIRPQPTVLPEVDLPAFPALTLQELAVDFEVDGQAFVSGIDERIGSAIDVRLRRDYAALRLQKGFDELISIGSVRGLEHFWYQFETVRRLLRDFRGRVLLADEVGLGKTIEACLALKEYWMRGLVAKALILTPPSLVGQWADELTSKFGLAAAVAESGKVTPNDDFWDRQPIVVASLPLVRQQTYRARLIAIDYDLVIVDEAHVLKKRTSTAWQLVNELKKRFLLLLSATPVGNDLSELYNLILLLRPGLLKTEAQFRSEFGNVAALQQADRRERLRALLREVMIRNTRAHIDVRLPRRLAATEVVSPTEAEADLQDRLSSYVRARYADGARTDRWRLMMLQMQAGSSPAALGAALDRHESAPIDENLTAVRAALEHVHHPAKTLALIELLKRSDDKTIVFTRFRATLHHLQLALEDAGFRVAMFHGGLTMAEKDRAIEQFEREADTLVSSEVGGVGRNLQFCRTVINYDLPWNPMQLEQRVGRVHRIGQTRDVFVFNFCLAGSLEEYILKVLHDKLNLFELVAGEIEMILGELEPERDFAEVVMDLWARAPTRDDRDSAFDQLADALIAARGRYQKTQEIDRALFREEFEA